jgi:hypothetical protein
MSDATSLKKQVTSKTIAEEARKLAESRNSQAQGEKAAVEATASMIAKNTFAKIMLAPDISPEAKKEALVKELTFSWEKSKEENRAKLQELAQFKEYLQEQRKILNREGIKLQDTKAFSELQGVIDDMTKSSIDFQERVKPLLEVLNAVFEIRKHNKITDVYREIQNDKEWEKEQKNILENLSKEIDLTKQRVHSLEKEKVRLRNDRTLFGLGSIKKSAQERIAIIDAVDIVDTKANLENLINQLHKQKEVLDAGPNSDSPELRAQKKVLKEFLDLTKDENIARQKSLIDAGVNYVDSSDTRLKSVLLTLDKLGKHAEVVSDANGMLRNIHLIMDESLKEVSSTNKNIKSDLSTTPNDESSIARMTREERLTEVNEYISISDEHAIDVANSIGGLTKHSVQIQAYKDTLRNESSSTKRLHLEGVSQMGEQLMSVISAISAAATSESRAVAANNFARMAEQNQTIVSQEVVRNASNIEVEANSIAKLVTELEDYGAVLNASSEIANQGYAKMRETVDAIRKVSVSVQDSISEFVSDRADAGIASGECSTSKDTNDKQADNFINPFDKLKG